MPEFSEGAANWVPGVAAPDSAHGGEVISVSV